MALVAGSLALTVEYAKDLKDVDWFCRQDPYCVVRVGEQTYRTKTARNGGKNPVWNETFNVNIINDNDVTIDIKDDDIGRDEFIGTCAFNLSRVREAGVDHLNVPVMSKKSGKQHGFICVTLKFTPNGAGGARGANAAAAVASAATAAAAGAAAVAAAVDAVTSSALAARAAQSAPAVQFPAQQQPAYAPGPAAATAPMAPSGYYNTPAGMPPSTSAGALFPQQQQQQQSQQQPSPYAPPQQGYTPGQAPVAAPATYTPFPNAQQPGMMGSAVQQPPAVGPFASQMAMQQQQQQQPMGMQQQQPMGMQPPVGGMYGQMQPQQQTTGGPYMIGQQQPAGGFMPGQSMQGGAYPVGQPRSLAGVPMQGPYGMGMAQQPMYGAGQGMMQPTYMGGMPSQMPVTEVVYVSEYPHHHHHHHHRHHHGGEVIIVENPDFY